MSRRAPSFVALTLAAAFPVAALAAAPVAVSPGAPDAVGRVETACPTFSWTYDPEATTVELAVYRLEASETGAAPEEAPPVLAVRLPAGAVSWTADAGDCLEPEGRYAWFVRGETDGFAGPWSEGNLFEVRLGPTATAAAAAAERHGQEAAADPAEVPGPRPPAASVGESAPAAPAGETDVRLAREPTPKPPEPVSFQADGGIVIGGNYRFTSPRLVDYRVPPSAFRLQRSDEDEGWRLQDGYGWVPTMSGAVADVHLVAPLDLPAGATLLNFHCDGFDNVEIEEGLGEVDVDDLIMTMAVTRRHVNSPVREVLASTSMITSGAIEFLRSSLSGTVDHRVSSLEEYEIEVVYKPESQGSSLRFYGCALRLAIERIDPR